MKFNLDNEKIDSIFAAILFFACLIIVLTMIILAIGIKIILTKKQPKDAKNINAHAGAIKGNSRIEAHWEDYR